MNWWIDVMICIYYGDANSFGSNVLNVEKLYDGLNCVCWEKNGLNFVGLRKIWAEICGIKYGMHYESEIKYYMG